MKQTWNQHVVKKENKSLVLATVKEHSPISRADVAQLTGLNKGTVSSLVSELISENLISESGPGQSSGGRRPVMLLFNQLAGYAIGLDLGVNYLLGMLTDLNGNVIFEKKVELLDTKYEKITDTIFTAIDDLLKVAPQSPYGVIGIGVAVPGIVSNEGKILFAPNLGWREVDLKSLLETKYQLPVVIENEANAGAYGEKMYGTGKTAATIIYVSIGIGIGVGLILDGVLYKGKSGLSGELGHMTIERNGLKCSCGNEGCWELYASEQALLKKAEKLDVKTESGDPISLDDLNHLANQGHKDSINLLHEIGDHIGIGINNIINTFNPELIIIGNRIASCEQWVKPSLEKRIKSDSLPFHQDDVTLNFSELKTHSSALGIVAFVTEKFLMVDSN